jgi:hypothetical protein
VSEQDLGERLRRIVEAKAAGFDPSTSFPEQVASRIRQRAARRRLTVTFAVATGVGATALVLTLGALTGGSRPRVTVAAVRTPEQPRPVASENNRHSARAPKATTSVPTAPPPLWSLFAPPRAASPLKAPTTRDSGGRTTRYVASGPRGAAQTSTSRPSRPTTTTAPRSTTTTSTTAAEPTTTTTTTAPPRSVSIDGPTTVCVDIPTTFSAVATDADTLQWDNGQSGSFARYVFGTPGPATVSVTATSAGSQTGASIGITVLATGEAPC